MQAKEDLVNHPKHYKEGKHECIDFISGWGYGFCFGNVVKYLTRHKIKGGRQDLEKAAWYFKRGVEDQEVGLRRVGEINEHEFLSDKDLPQEIKECLMLLHRGVFMKRGQFIDQSFELLVKYLESSDTKADGERSNGAGADSGCSQQHTQKKRSNTKELK